MAGNKLCCWRKENIPICANLPKRNGQVKLLFGNEGCNLYSLPWYCVRCSLKVHVPTMAEDIIESSLTFEKLVLSLDNFQ